MIVQHGAIIGLDLAMAAPSSAGFGRGLRFSLRELLAMTAFVAVGLVSLLHANGWIPSFWFTALLLSVGVAAACFRAGRSTGFAEGYALFAGGYALLLLLSAWPQSNQFMANPDAIHRMLITHSLNDWAYERLLPLAREAPTPSQPVPGGGGFFGPGPIAQFGGGGFGGSNLSLQIGSGRSSILDYPDSDNFSRVAHCLWAIVLGCLGGRLMQALRTAPATQISP